MSQNMMLMMKDTPVMRINFDEVRYDVLDELHLPYQLKGCIRRCEMKEGMSSSEIRAAIVDGAQNNMAVTRYLAQRVLPITRENAKKLYALFDFEQMQDDYSKAKIAITCRAVSLQDNYWIKLEDDPVSWKDVDIHQNHLNEVVAQVALHGTSLTLTGTPVTPELTSFGAYAKAWHRENGELYLYKKGNNGSSEARIEVMVSNLLKKTNANSLEYVEGRSDGDFVSKCKCMTEGDIVMLSAMDFESYCNRNGLNFMEEVKKIDADLFYKMCVVDYLVANRDRHGMNWGFFYNCETMEIIGCHPLYDHNNAFDTKLMANPDVPYLVVPTMTMRRAAKVAAERTDFHFTEPIKREDFITERQYKYFAKAAKELGLEMNPIQKQDTMEIETPSTKRPSKTNPDNKQEINVIKSILSDRPDGESYKDSPNIMNQQKAEAWKTETDSDKLYHAVLFSNGVINDGAGLAALRNIMENPNVPADAFVLTAMGKLDNQGKSMMTNTDVREIWQHILKNPNCSPALAADIALETILNKDQMQPGIFLKTLTEAYGVTRNNGFKEIASVIADYLNEHMSEEKALSAIDNLMKDRGMQSLMHKKEIPSTSEPEKDLSSQLDGHSVDQNDDLIKQ